MQIHYMKNVSWPSNISIKILLAKIAFLFYSILLCYLLNMSSSCIGSISWYCFVVPFISCCSFVPLFCDIPIVPPVFQKCASVPVFCQYSATDPVFRRCSVFRCSWFYSMPWVPNFNVNMTLDCRTGNNRTQSTGGTTEHQHTTEYGTTTEQLNTPEQCQNNKTPPKHQRNTLE